MIAERARFWWRWIAGPGALLLCVGLLWSTGPAWAAHQGHGRPGEWIATQILCSKGHCEEVGTFAAADGTDHRSGIQLSGVKTLPIGLGLAAVDSGGEEVYRPGAPGWWHNLVGAAVGGVVAAAWLWTFPVAVWRRRRALRTAANRRPGPPA